MPLRILAILAVVGMLSAPSHATAPEAFSHRGQCLRLTRQMARYARDVGWAQDRGNELWAQASAAQYQRLLQRRNRLCPQMKPPNPFAEFAQLMGRALQLAAKAAIKYFTGGFDGILGLF